MSIYSEDELEPPTWLTKEFFHPVVKTLEDANNLEVTDLILTPATLKGDHFASCMFRGKVDYKLGSGTATKTRSLIIKTLPEPDTPKGQMLKDSKLFETEISMYMETLPKVEEILSKHGDHTRFGPKVVYAALEPNKVIIFEDLCELGYSPLRGRYLETEELKAVVQKIAKLHAVTYVLGKSEDSNLITKYKDGLFSDARVFQAGMISGGMKIFKNMLENSDEFRVYLPQFLEIEKEAVEHCIALYNAYPNGETDDIFVLNHGDFHLKNLMLKENPEHQFEDVILVDFQLSVFGPSMIDWVYATFMMFDAEHRCAKKNEIMRFYFENFIETLKNIKFNGKFPNYADFQMSGLKYRIFAKYMMVAFLPMFTKVATALPEDWQNIKEDDVFAAKSFDVVYQSPAFINELRTLLPFMLNSGYLD